ncbi:hypothetical protein KKI23_00945 [Patescibacteria group bacterium]|nr:hypothetical protein [Patescibacteria group bacterium]
MTVSILTILIFFFLWLGIFYYRSLNLENLQTKTESDKQVKKFLLVPLLLTAINLICLKFGTAIELIIMVLLMWLNIIFFFLFLIKRHRATGAILLATLFSQVLVSAIYLTQSEYLNNLFIFLALLATVILVFTRFKIYNWFWISFLIIMSFLDAVFVWLIPAVPQAEAQVQPLVFSLLIKLGNISLGAGDVVFLLLSIIILAKRFTQKVLIWQALILSLAIPSALFIQNFTPSSATSFPFLTVLTPIFLLLFWITNFISAKELKT